MLEDGIVEVVHTGKMSQEDAEQARLKAAALCAEHGASLLLADLSAAVIPDDPAGLFEFNASHYDVLPAGTRIATVVSPATDPAGVLPFGETVAYNRGILLGLFPDRTQALAWLSQNV